MKVLNEDFIEELLLEDNNFPIDISSVISCSRKRRSILQSASEFLPKIPDLEIMGDPLRDPQKMLGVAFYSWLKCGQNKPVLMGRVVLPMGIGKLRSAVMLSEMVNGRTLFFCYSKNLGDDAQENFKTNQLTKNYGKEKSVGQCYGGILNLNSDVTVAHFASLKNMTDFDWSSLDLIVVDEADVNGLSEKRADFLSDIAFEYGIPIVAMSATEQQSSGKNLDNVFPDEILRMPIPGALPQLFELDLVPKMSFNDLYFDLQLGVDSSDFQVSGDLTSITVHNFIKSTAWNQMVLDHFYSNYSLNNENVKGVVIFRDNKLVDDFVQRASKMGIKAKGFTGDLSLEEMSLRQEALDKGEIDLLVGSKLLGRGFNVEGINVVYNSTISYSPQIFWQANGRGMRLDNENKDKIVDVFAVLPRFMFDKKTGDPLKNIQRPLCHNTFFDKEYFDRNRDDNSDDNSDVLTDSQISIADIEDVKSAEEVSNILEKYRKKPDGFVSKPRIYSELLSSLSINKDFSRMLRFLRFSSNYKIRKCAEHLLPDVDVVVSDSRVELEKEDKDFEFYYDKKINLTYEEERKLIDDYKNWSASEDPKLKKISDLAFKQLLDAHMPFIESLAKYCANASVDVDIDDFIQIGCEQFFKALNNWRGDSRVRFVTYFMKYTTYSILREKNEINNIIRFPDNVISLLDEIDKLQIKALVEKGRTLNEDELAALMNVSIKKIKELLALPNVDIVDPFLLDELEGQAIDPEQTDYIFRKELRGKVLDVLETLEPRKELIMRLRYGLNDGEKYDCDHAFREIGKMLLEKKYQKVLTPNRTKELRQKSYVGSSPPLIRTIEQKAVCELRHPSRSKKLRPFLNDEDFYRSLKMLTYYNEDFYR